MLITVNTNGSNYKLEAYKVQKNSFIDWDFVLFLNNLSKSTKFKMWN